MGRTFLYAAITGHEVNNAAGAFSSACKTKKGGPMSPPFFNFKNPVIANKNIRDALSMLVDIEKFSEFGQVVKGPIPPISWAYSPDLKNYNFDLNTASKIIEKEITASKSAELNFITFFDYYDVADVRRKACGA